MTEPLRIEMVACEATILREIADSRCTRRTIAQTYALAMRSRETVDWPRINQAIVERWGLVGLAYIKAQAHSGRCFKENPS